MQVWIVGSKRPIYGHHHPLEVINNKIYLFGGLNGEAPGGGMDAIQVGELVSGAGGQIDMRWELSTSKMPLAEGSAGHALINGKVRCFRSVSS